MTRTLPYVPLLEYALRLGIRSRSSTEYVNALLRTALSAAPANPMSSTFTLPEYSAPGYRTLPILTHPNVTVLFAFTAVPMILPSDAFIPEGISTERTHASDAFICVTTCSYLPSMFLLIPMPNSPSMIILYSVSLTLLKILTPDAFAIPS